MKFETRGFVGTFRRDTFKIKREDGYVFKYNVDSPYIEPVTNALIFRDGDEIVVMAHDVVSKENRYPYHPEFEYYIYDECRYNHKLGVFDALRMRKLNWFSPIKVYYFCLDFDNNIREYVNEKISFREFCDYDDLDIEKSETFWVGGTDLLLALGFVPYVIKSEFVVLAAVCDPIKKVVHFGSRVVQTKDYQALHDLKGLERSLLANAVRKRDKMIGWILDNEELSIKFVNYDEDIPDFSLFNQCQKKISFKMTHAVPMRLYRSRQLPLGLF